MSLVGTARSGSPGCGPAVRRPGARRGRERGGGPRAARRRCRALPLDPHRRRAGAAPGGGLGRPAVRARGRGLRARRVHRSAARRSGGPARWRGGQPLPLPVDHGAAHPEQGEVDEHGQVPRELLAEQSEELHHEEPEQQREVEQLEGAQDPVPSPQRETHQRQDQGQERGPEVDEVAQGEGGRQLPGRAEQRSRCEHGEEQHSPALNALSTVEVDDPLPRPVVAAHHPHPARGLGQDLLQPLEQGQDQRVVRIGGPQQLHGPVPLDVVEVVGRRLLEQLHRVDHQLPFRERLALDDEHHHEVHHDEGGVDDRGNGLVEVVVVAGHELPDLVDEEAEAHPPSTVATVLAALLRKSMNTSCASSMPRPPHRRWARWSSSPRAAGSRSPRAAAS